MKTCKKILAGVLVFAMMLSMCAFVSADETTETPETPATSVILQKYTFDNVAVTDSISINDTETGLITKYDVKVAGVLGFGVSKVSFGGNGIDTAAIKARAEGDNYASHQNSQGALNFRASDADFATLDPEGNYPVLGVSYDIMIPADDQYKENLRQQSFALGTTTASSFKTQVSTVVISIEDGKISATAGSSATSKFKKGIDYTYGEWVNFDIRVWSTPVTVDDVEHDRMTIGVYANGALIYYGISKADIVGLAAGDFRFNYNNSPDGETKVEAKSGTWKNGILTDDGDGNAETVPAETIVSTNCYDNVIVALYDEASKVSDAELNAAIAAQKAATPYVRLAEYTCDALNATHVKDGVGTSGKAVFNNTGEYSSYAFAQGSATDDHAAKTYTISEDGTYTDITYSSYRYLVANFRSPFSEYIQKGTGDTSVFVYENNLKLRDFNAPVSGSMGIGLDLNNSAYTTDAGQTVAKRTSNDLSVGFSISTDGTFEFGDSIGGTGRRVNGAERSEARTVKAGEWINVKEVFEITHNETRYDIKVYGIYNDAVIYENEFYITYKDYDYDGVADDLHIGAMILKLGTDNTTHTETVTSLNDIYFEKNNNFDWSTIDTDAWFDRSINVTKDASGNIDVYAKKGEGTFTNETLVIAICNANGTVKEVITSKEVVDGTMSYEVPASKVEAGNIVKAFVFDTLTSAVPQMRNGSYIVE